LLWKFGWGLLFVCMMTILCECAPHIGLSKRVDDAPPIASQPLPHVVK